MAKNYRYIQGTDDKTPQTIKKIDVVEKEITFEKFFQTSVHTDMKSTQEAIFQQKNPKSIHSWSNHFWNSIPNVSVNVQYEKTST